MGGVQQTQVQTEEQGVSRRSFIKGVIASGAAVSASNYVLRNGQGVALAQAPGGPGTVPDRDRRARHQDRAGGAGRRQEPPGLRGRARARLS